MGVEALTLKVQKLELELQQARGQLMQAILAANTSSEKGEVRLKDVLLGIITFFFAGKQSCLEI